MTAVADCPCLWLAPEGQSGAATLRVPNVFPEACRVDPRNRAAQLSAVERMDAALVLVLPEHVLPGSILPAMRPDPLLSAGGLVVSWLSRNAVTGEFAVAPAPALWPRDVLLAWLRNGGPAPPAGAVLPHCAADWSFNHDAAKTLATGFASTDTLRKGASGDPDAAARLAVHASLGADAAYGYWWIIGACHALMGRYRLTECLALELQDTPDGDGAAQRARDLVRRARSETGLPLMALAPEESRLMKELRFRMPPRSVYADLAAVYDTLGDAGRAPAMRYRRASEWLWGNPRSAAS